jgi:hypothetical protein
MADEALKKLGDKASNTASALKSLAPGDSEAAGLRAAQQNVDDAAAYMKPAPVAAAPAQKEVPNLLHPLAKYGDKPGEKRLDSEGNVIPSYDLGGDVPEDQIAQVHEGEKVLTPEEAAQYRAEHPDKEEGAPADFSGRVFPNPDHIKPVLDTEIKPEVEKITGGAKMSTDLADPADKKAFPNEISAKTPANTDSLSLKPYGQVMEDKASDKAKEIASTTAEGGAPTEGAAQPEEKPKKTYGDLLAAQWMERNGIKPGSMEQGAQMPGQEPGLKPYGNLEEGATQPKAMQPAGGPQQGMKPINMEPTATPAAAPTAAPTGKEAFKAKMADYDKQYQDLMDQAAKTNNPDLAEQAGRVKEAKLAYEHAHPWGSPESAHPGVLGKLGHVAEQVVSRTPFGVSAIAATVPGSEGYRAAEGASAREQVKESSAQSANEDKAAAKAGVPAGYKQVTGGAVDPKNPDAGPQVAFANEKNPNDIVYKGPLTAKPSAGSDKEAFKAVLKKIGTAEVADPGQQKAALESAHNSKAISDDEYKDALSYLGSTANAPATQATQSSEKRTAGKTMYFNLQDGTRKALTAEQAKAEGLDPNSGVVENEGQVSKDREKNSTYRVIESSLGNYEKHIGNAKITPDDITQMTTITEDAEKPDYISKLIAGGLDDLLGHPVTGYSEKLMKGTLTKNQYQDMSPAARQLVADYYTTMMAHFANMKAAQGSIPRNPDIIKIEMHTIPKPFLSAEEAKPAFQNYKDQVALRNADNVDFGGHTAKPETTNTPEGAITMPDGSHPADVAKGPNGDTIVWSGKQGEGWIDLATGKPVK